MRILVDKYIPFLQGVLNRSAEISFLEPEQFTPENVRAAEALIIRTRTRCDAALLDGSRVRFIATATIGTDHIDFEYCRAHDIHVASCPGCNAQAVCDYVEEAVRTFAIGHGRHPDDYSIGIVGVGHVGSKVEKMALGHHMQVVLNDPPRGINGDVTACDIITFHTPLIQNGDYPTWHLCNKSFLARCKPDALIINAARGGVVDEQALLEGTQPFVLDTWENEPDISHEVLCRAWLASMHIAGYSVQGKRNASQMCLDALCDYFRLPARPIAPDNEVRQGDCAEGWLRRISDCLKAQPDNFESMRKNYKLR